MMGPSELWMQQTSCSFVYNAMAKDALFLLDTGQTIGRAIVTSQFEKSFLFNMSRNKCPVENHCHGPCDIAEHSESSEARNIVKNSCR